MCARRCGEPADDVVCCCHLLNPNLEDCRRWMKEFQEVKMEPVFREADGCVNAVGATGLKQDQVYVVCKTCPMEVCNRLLKDCIGSK